MSVLPNIGYVDTMRKIASLIVMLCLPFMACSADYQEGKHYTQVSEKGSAKPEVREFFSFYCPHCMKFEPYMDELKKNLPADVPFVLNHVDFLRAASPKIQQMLTKATLVAKQMKMEKKLSGALFNYIQIQRAVITSEKDIRNIFVANGADGAQFDKLMKSFSINSQAKALKKQQDMFSKKGALTGVPAVFVNGKYRINPQALDRKDFMGDYKKLVNYLLTK